jgi:hypothetical protein
VPKEPEGYREQLEDLNTYFDGKRLLTVSDVEKYTGRERRYVIKRFGIKNPKDGITTVQLALRLTKSA